MTDMQQEARRRPFGYHDALVNAAAQTSMHNDGGTDGTLTLQQSPQLNDGDTDGTLTLQQSPQPPNDLFSDLDLTIEPIHGQTEAHIGRNLWKITRSATAADSSSANDIGSSDGALNASLSDPFDGHDSLLYCHVPALLRYTTASGGAQADFSGGSQASGDVVGGGNLGAIAYQASAAILLAFHHANTGDGSVAPELEGLPQRCPIRFTSEILDKGGDGLDSVTALTQMVTRSPWPEKANDNPEGEGDDGTMNNATLSASSNSRSQPCAIIGAHVSKASEKLASLSAVFDLPVVSSSAMSPDLNDPEQYPTFLRTHTDVNGFGEMAVSFLANNLGINKFGLLYTNDGYGYGFSRSVLEAAVDVGAEVVGGGVPYLPPSNRDDSQEGEGDLRAALKVLADTGCNYFVADFYAESFAR